MSAPGPLRTSQDLKTILAQQGLAYDDAASPVVRAEPISGLPPISERAGREPAEAEVDVHGALVVSEESTHGAYGGTLSSTESIRVSFKAPYAINSRTVVTATSNGGTVTAADSTAVLQTSTAANGLAALQSRESLRYVAGQGNAARFTAVFAPGVASSQQEVGILDDNDGFGFGFNGASFGILIRRGGVDTWIPQASWNGDDRFDGNGPSAIKFDPTKGNVFQIRMQWLGFGVVRWYVEDPRTGDFVVVHVLHYPNSSSEVTILQPNLPVRARIFNSGNATNLTMKLGSFGGLSEGSPLNPAEDVRNSFTYAKAVTTTGVALFAIRNKATDIFSGVNINHITTHVDLLSLRNASGGVDGYVQLILNPTYTGPSFVDLSAANSVMQTDIAGAWAVGTGTVLGTWCLASGQTTNELLDSLDIRLVPGDVLVAVGFSESATPTIRAALSWHEEN